VTEWKRKGEREEVVGKGLRKKVGRRDEARWKGRKRKEWVVGKEILRREEIDGKEMVIL